MIKKVLLGVGILFILGTGSLSFAYIIDGRLDDWGVIPFKDWSPDSPTADRVIQDGIRPDGGRVWGGEPYDVEALYFDDDGRYFYFAMVSSYPLMGRRWRNLAGDLGLNLDGRRGSEYGIKIRGLKPKKSLQYRSLWRNPKWKRCKHPEANPIWMMRGEFIGLTELFYRNAGYIEGRAKRPYKPRLWKNWGITYILEGRVNRFLFDPLPLEGRTIVLHWAEYCGNDYINLKADINHPPIPEPGSLTLFTIAVLSLGGLSLRKFRKIK